MMLCEIVQAQRFEAQWDWQTDAVVISGPSPELDKLWDKLLEKDWVSRLKPKQVVAALRPLVQLQALPVAFIASLSTEAPAAPASSSAPAAPASTSASAAPASTSAPSLDTSPRPHKRLRKGNKK